MDKKEIGLKIKRIREDLDESQTEFAQRFGRTQQAVGQWEIGETLPNGETMIKILELGKGRLPMISDNEGLPETFRDGMGREIKIEDAVQMMTEIMDGPQIYKAALVSSVKALFKAGRNEVKLEVLEGRMNNMEKELMESQGRIERMLAEFLSAFAHSQKGAPGAMNG